MTSRGHEQPGILAEARAILVLAGPLVANNLAIAGMNFTDTVMSGRLGTQDLAAVAVGGSVWLVVFLTGLGVLMAINPTVAHVYGAGRDRDVGVFFRQGLWLSQGMALVLLALLSQAGRVLDAVGVDPAITPLTVGYLTAIAPGMPAVLAMLACRFTSEGIGWTRPIMVTALVGFTVNIFANWVLMFGNLGFPAMGAVGCGAASAVAMWCMLATMVTFTRRHPRYRPFRLWERFDAPSAARLRELLGLGGPIAVSVVSEAGLFSAVSLLMGSLGATIVAAHQIAINYSALMFMVPLAIHSALTVRVGQTLGRGDPYRARRIGLTGIGLCGAVMAVSAIGMLLFRHHIAAFYTGDEEVQALAVSLLAMAMIFQVSDGLQVGGAGALRGYKDTRIPMLLNFFSYWGVAFPMAWYFGLVAKQGPQAVWVGLIVGLSLTAIALNARFLWISAPRRIPAAVGPA